MHRSWQYIILFISTFCTTALGQDTTFKLTLHQALAKGLESSIEVKAARYQYIDVYYAELVKRSQLKSNVEINGNLPNYIRTVQDITQPDGFIAFQPIQYNNSALNMVASKVIAETGARIYAVTDLQRFDNLANKSTNYNGLPIRVGIEQPLFQHNPYKWIKELSPIRVKVAERNYQSTIEELSLKIVGGYFNLLAVQLDLEIAISNEANSDTLYKIALERYDLGKISQDDLLQLKRELVLAQKEVEAAVVQLKNQKDLFLTTLGASGMPLDALQIPNALEYYNIDYDMAVQKAKSNRPELHQNQYDQIVARRDLDLAKKSNNFDASLIASAGLVRSATLFEDIYRDPQNEQALSLTFRMPIVQGGQRKAELKRFEAQLEFSGSAQEQIHREIETNVIVLCRALENSMNQLELAEELSTIAQERYQISKNRYLYGDISITDLTLSIREKDNTQRQYLRGPAKYVDAALPAKEYNTVRL